MEFHIQTQGNNDVINITDHVGKAIQESSVENGMAFVFSPHTTVGITLTEDEKGVRKDMDDMLQRIVPQGKTYHHDGAWAGDENGYAHIRSALIKPFVVIPVRQKKLLLGAWQSVLFIDFDDTARERTVYVEVLKNA